VYSDPWLEPALRYISTISKCGFVDNSKDISAELISSTDRSLVCEVVTVKLT